MVGVEEWGEAVYPLRIRPLTNQKVSRDSNGACAGSRPLRTSIQDDGIYGVACLHV